MTKAEFLTKFHNDHAFKAECQAKGIRVIQGNVVFLDRKGHIKDVAGAYVK